MQNQHATLVRSLRGAPLTCLFYMMLCGHQVGTTELVHGTGLSKGSISNALKALEQAGLAAQYNRYNGWATTALVQQLALSPAVNVEAQTLRLPSCSSSSFSSSSAEEEKQLLPPQNQVEAQNLRLPEWQDLMTILVNDCGCPRKTAQLTIAQLEHSDQPPHYHEYEALMWLSYCLNGEGKGIQHIGQFIAVKLAHDEPCPSWYNPPSGDDLSRRIRRLESKYWPDEE